MYIILGGTGQVGSAAALSLLDKGEAVTIVTRDASRGLSLEAAGARIVAVNIRDVAALREVFSSGKRAFLLNPPATPSGDTDAEERANVVAIVQALQGSGLEKVVAASTYGARPGDRCGDLTVLHEFEQLLKAQSIPSAINRGAYYMSNWGGLLDTVRDSGKLPSFIPADVAIPMVAPQDLGEATARRLMEPVNDTGLRCVEGPEHYTPRDVAEAFSEALDITVEVSVVPREAWEVTFMRLGFSKLAAQSYVCMTNTITNGDNEKPHSPDRGRTSLRSYIHDLIKGSK